MPSRHTLAMSALAGHAWNDPPRHPPRTTGCRDAFSNASAVGRAKAIGTVDTRPHVRPSEPRCWRLRNERNQLFGAASPQLRHEHPRNLASFIFRSALRRSNLTISIPVAADAGTVNSTRPETSELPQLGPAIRGNRCGGLNGDCQAPRETAWRRLATSEVVNVCVVARRVLACRQQEIPARTSSPN